MTMVTQGKWTNGENADLNDPLALSVAEKASLGFGKVDIDGRPVVDGQILKEGTKKDEGKPRWELIAYDALGGIAKILTLGAIKYAPRNWEKGIMYGRVFGAIMRHLTAWWSGESTDKESGLSHLDHAMCELMFLSAYEKRGMTQFDDRPTTIELEVKANS